MTEESIPWRGLVCHQCRKQLLIFGPRIIAGGVEDECIYLERDCDELLSFLQDHAGHPLILEVIDPPDESEVSWSAPKDG